jgi:hypothetical protein
VTGSPIVSVVTMACCSLFALEARAASCPNFVRDAKQAIGKPVAALLRLEHEMSDRIKGLDSRPFEYLRDEVKKTADVISDPAALKREEEATECRNATRPIRKICADATALLVAIIEKHVAAAKPDYDKPQYAAAIAECEKLLGLKPLKTLIRGND